MHKPTEDKQAHPQAAGSAPVGVDAEPMFYLQDTRQYVGNCPMWWAKDGQGYTTALDVAHRFTREEAIRQAASRETDVAWPCADIDAIQRPTVDMQEMRRLKPLDAALEKERAE